MSQVSPLLETSSYSKLFKCQDSGEGEEGEVPRPSQSNTQSDECCVIYQELPLDNITQTVTAEINLHGDSSAPSPPPTVLMSVSAAGLPDDVESADICQHPESPAAPRRTSSIVKRLQSAISGIYVYIWQMVQLGFRTNCSLTPVPVLQSKLTNPEESIKLFSDI